MRCFADISAINREKKAWYSSIIVCITFAQYCNGPYMSLQNSLTEVFSNFLLNYNCCLIAIGINAVAVIKNSEQSFNIFDAHCSDLHGIPHSLFMHTVLLLTICTIVNRDNKWEFQIWFFLDHHMEKCSSLEKYSQSIISLYSKYSDSYFFHCPVLSFQCKLWWI